MQPSDAGVNILAEAPIIIGVKFLIFGHIGKSFCKQKCEISKDSIFIGIFFKRHDGNDNKYYYLGFHFDQNWEYLKMCPGKSF